MSDRSPGVEAPLLRRFPALARLPRVAIGTLPTPVHRVVMADGRTLHLKRDDRTGAAIGGNKVRGLEWLLGDIRAGDHVVTVGPRGSTHALATALYARRLGARVTIVRWNQEMNDAARRVDARLRRETRVIDARWVAAAYVLAASLRLSGGTRWIPAGGASPLAVLGHVNGALELADQIGRGECVQPERVLVPLGTGGTAAGLLLGFRLAALDVELVAVRVAPRVIARARRVLKLAHVTASIIERMTGETVPRPDRARLRVEHAFYAGGYGRPTTLERERESALEDAGVRLDDTYSRKAFAAALAQPGDRNLLWLTFDGRLMEGTD